jgi:predicted esterase
MNEKSIKTPTHGRFLVEAPATGLPLLVGFHGYAETAEHELQRLKTIEGSEDWIIVSIQGLHRFYRRRSNDVIAGWMTRQNREEAIEDNIIYTTTVIDSVACELAPDSPVAFSGFSQGVAMAFRCAARVDRTVKGLMALGGDVPPELDANALQRIPAVLIGKGTRDEWYTAEKLAADEQRLRAAGVNVTTVTFDGGHEWTAAFAEAAARFLKGIL